MRGTLKKTTYKNGRVNFPARFRSSLRAGGTRAPDTWIKNVNNAISTGSLMNAASGTSGNAPLENLARVKLLFRNVQSNLYWASSLKINIFA